jgi:hypothetical protein
MIIPIGKKYMEYNRLGISDDDNLFMPDECNVTRLNEDELTFVLIIFDILYQPKRLSYWFNLFKFQRMINISCISY